MMMAIELFECLWHVPFIRNSDSIFTPTRLYCIVVPVSTRLVVMIRLTRELRQSRSGVVAHARAVTLVAADPAAVPLKVG